MKLRIVLFAMLVFILAGGGFAIYKAAVAPQVFKPSELQLLRLQVKQRDAQIAQIAAQDLNNKFQKTLDELRAEGDKVKAENKWDSTVVFNPNDLTFTKPTLTASPTVLPNNQPPAKK